MNWIKNGQLAFTGLCLLGAAQAQAVGTLYAGFDDTSTGVSIRSGTTLTNTGTIPVGDAPGGLAAGISSNIYVAGGDTIYNFATTGGLTVSDTVAGAAYSDVALLGAQIFVTSSGATPGISARDLNTLVESDFFGTAYSPTSIEDGFGRLYVTAGDTLYIVAADGTELANASSGTGGLNFVDSALSGTRLYAATGGTANSISVRNPITLAEITSFALPFAVDGMVAGDDDDLFLTSGDTLYRYSTAGVELDMQADAARTFTDVAFIADPLPPAIGTVLAITADGAGDSVSSLDAETLAAAGSFTVAAAAADGMALSASNGVYLAAGDTLYHYDTSGVLLADVTQANAVFADVALVDGDLIAATQNGLSIRSATSLAATSSLPLSFVASSVAPAGSPGEVYITSGNEVFLYTLSGTELASFAGNAGFTYTDVALVKNVVYATYNSAGGDGISVLDPGSLLQSDVINTTIAATGITPGGGNDYYISGGDTVVHYALDEVLATFTAGAGTTYPDVVFSAQGSNSATSVIAATLPASRSVQVNNIASAFATVINTGQVTASGCRIEPATMVAADFSYQTTDPGTNELVGSPDTPANIASAGSQTFLFTFTPTATFAATDVQLNFLCNNAPAAPIFSGLNTLQLSSDANPVPDVIALASTPTTPGIVDIPGVGGTGFFAVASVNVGISGSIDVNAEMTDGDPNVTLSICETNPATGACINPTAPTTGVVTTTINANDTPTFSIFATSSAAVALDPAGKRIRVNFADTSGGAPRGATSVAVRTQ